MKPEEIEKAFASIESGLQKRETLEGPYAVLDELYAVSNLRHEMAVMAKMIELKNSRTHNVLNNKKLANSIARRWREQAEAELKGKP